MSAIIGFQTISGSFTISVPPTGPQYLMNGDSAGLYTAVTGDVVTALSFTAVQSSYEAEVGVYDTATNTLIGSATATSIYNGSATVAVNFPLTAGHTYAVGFACVAASNSKDLYGGNATGACATNGLTGSSALQNPFVSTGTVNNNFEVWATVTGSAPSANPGQFFFADAKIPGAALAMFMPLSWAIGRRNRRAQERREDGQTERRIILPRNRESP